MSQVNIGLVVQINFKLFIYLLERVDLNYKNFLTGVIIFFSHKLSAFVNMPLRTNTLTTRPYRTTIYLLIKLFTVRESHYIEWNILFFFFF